MGFQMLMKADTLDGVDARKLDTDIVLVPRRARLPGESRLVCPAGRSAAACAGDESTKTHARRRRDRRCPVRVQACVDGSGEHMSRSASSVGIWPRSPSPWSTPSASPETGVRGRPLPRAPASVWKMTSPEAQSDASDDPTTATPGGSLAEVLSLAPS